MPADFPVLVFRTAGSDRGIEQSTAGGVVVVGVVDYVVVVLFWMIGSIKCV